MEIISTPEIKTATLRDIDIWFVGGDKLELTLREDDTIDFDDTIEAHVGVEYFSISRQNILYISERTRVVQLAPEPKAKDDAPNRGH